MCCESVVGKMARSVCATDNDKQGHRERLRDKILSGNTDTLLDYELLEYLLTVAIPRKDVKPIAKSLLNKYKTLANVVNASVESLMEVSGVKETTAAVIKIVGITAVRMLKVDLVKKSVISSWDKLLDYCRASLAYNTEENVRVIYLDSKNCIIADEIQSKGALSQVNFYPQEVVKKAMYIGAAGVVIAHNHPSCDCKPSIEDKVVTKTLKDGLSFMDIKLIDHIIVSTRGYFSFKVNGLL